MPGTAVWPPRSAGPGGGSGFSPQQVAFNPAKFAAGPEIAVDSTGGAVTQTAGSQLNGTEWLYIGAAAAAFYFLGARHLGQGTIPFRRRP